MVHEYDALCFVDFACSASYVGIDKHPNKTDYLDGITFSPHCIQKIWFCSITCCRNRLKCDSRSVFVVMLVSEVTNFFIGSSKLYWFTCYSKNHILYTFSFSDMVLKNLKWATVSGFRILAIL